MTDVKPTFRKAIAKTGVPLHSYLQNGDAKEIVIFHHCDMDGAYAAAAALHKLQGYQIPIRIVPVNYDKQDSLSIIADIDSSSVVFVLDFAFSRAVTMTLGECTAFSMTLDHHVGNQELCVGLSNGHFDMSASGAKMAWEYFNPDKPVPLAFTLVDNRDLWTKRDGREDDFHVAMQVLESQSVNHSEFIHKLPMFFDDAITKTACVDGETMTLKMKADIKRNTRDKQLAEVNVGGYPAIFFNCGVDQSEACEHVYLMPEYRNCIVVAYYIQASGKVNLSLRKGPECKADLNKIAKANFNGGGHKQAAGGQITMDHLQAILSRKNKQALCWWTADVEAVLNDSSLLEHEKVEVLLKLPRVMADRFTCEKNTELKQIIPYIAVFTEGDMLLGYHRPTAGDESRLHGSFSIGFGGHVDSDPFYKGIEEHLVEETLRELKEEIGYNDTDNIVRSDLLDKFNSGFGIKIINTQDDAGVYHIGLGTFVQLPIGSEGLKTTEEIGDMVTGSIDSFRTYSRNVEVEAWTVEMLKS